MLVKIPAAAGERFPEAADLILRLVVPQKIASVYFDFDLSDGNAALISRFPREIFDLVFISIDLKEVPPFDLDKFLDEMIGLIPKLRDDARYVALRNRLQRF